MLQKAWPILFAIWVSGVTGCAKGGPEVEVCIVDAVHRVFQCAKGKSNRALPLAQGVGLKCASPPDTEEFLKACKQGTLLQVTQCVYTDQGFLCLDILGHQKIISISDADNYACLNDQDYKRITERCHH